jgi:hypothetical protein
MPLKLFTFTLFVLFNVNTVVRVKEREEKYMSEVEADAYIKEHEKNPKGY